MSSNNSFVLPGTILDVNDSKCLIGPGVYCQIPTLEQLAQDAENFSKPFSSKCGVFRFASGKAFVDNEQKRYIPGIGDPVVGVIEGRLGDGFRVSIGCAQQASLPATSFEGAESKKTRPQLETKTLVYARVVSTESYELELSCVDAKTGKAGKFGPLEDGLLFNLPLRQTRRLLDPAYNLPKLQEVGALFAFDIAVGLNGRIWLNAASGDLILDLANLISDIGNISLGDLKKRLKTLKQKHE